MSADSEANQFRSIHEHVVFLNPSNPTVHARRGMHNVHNNKDPVPPFANDFYEADPFVVSPRLNW
jgi:hypothetical protein